jgi:hypothetical protein
MFGHQPIGPAKISNLTKLQKTAATSQNYPTLTILPQACSPKESDNQAPVGLIS